MPVRARRSVFLLVFLAWALQPAALLGQTDTGSLTVLVTDGSGLTVPGGTVTVRSQATGATRELVSDDAGRAVFAALQPGLYGVSVALSGFKEYVNSTVRLQVAQSATLPVALEVGAVSESVQVTGQVSLVTPGSSAHGTVITEEKIAALPLNGRQFIQLALLVPGANAGGRAVQQNVVRQNQVGGFSVAGGRTNNTAFLLDGAVNTDPDYNSLNYSPSIDAIAEFQVQTAQFTAEYGRAGGQVNVVTKSGSAALKGSAFEYHRNRRFDEKPFNLAGDLPQFQRDNFGGSLGGPVLRNRLFFFGAYEQLRRREGAASLTTVTVPTAFERQGDFSQSPGGIFDPLTSNTSRTAFPNGRIPGDRINPLALAALQALPLPNTGTRGYVNSDEILEQDIYNYSLRLDVNLAPGNSAFAAQVDAQQRPGRGGLLDRADARGRRRPALRGAPPGAVCLGRRRQRRSAGAGGGGGGQGCRAFHGDARGEYRAGAGRHLPGDRTEEQRGVHGVQRRGGRRTHPGRRPGAAAPAQRADQADEAARLRQGLLLRARRAGCGRRHGVPARVAGEPALLHADGARVRKGNQAPPGRLGRDQERETGKNLTPNLQQTNSRTNGLGVA